MLYQSQITKKLIPFFGEEISCLADLAMIAQPVSFNAGDTILYQNDVSADIYYISKGTAKAVIYSVEGSEIWISQFEAYSIFGEMAAFGAPARTADIIAVSDVELLSFSQVAFLAVMAKHGSIGIKISELLVSRITDTTRRMFELSAFSSKGRVYNELLRLAEEDENGQMVINNLPAFTEMAKKINTTRETISRTVSDIEKLGYIRREGNCLYILAPQNLGD